MKNRSIFYKILEFLYLKQKNNLAFTDGLTGVHNRLHYDMVVKPKYYKKECYIIYVDINNLKETNDKFGHHEGNKLIKNVANELIKIKSIKDINRIGGDEFVITTTNKIPFETFNLIENITYGIYKKNSYTDFVEAVKEADNIMYQKKILTKKGR